MYASHTLCFAVQFVVKRHISTVHKQTTAYQAKQIHPLDWVHLRCRQSGPSYLCWHIERISTHAKYTTDAQCDHYALWREVIELPATV